MTVVATLFRRWLRLALALAAGLCALLATTQARRWFAADRAWSAAEQQRLVRDACTALAVVLVVAACLAAVEVLVRLRRNGVLATLCARGAGMRRLAAASAAMAAAAGGAIALAVIGAAALPEPAVLRRSAAGWLWQPWPSVDAVAVALEPTAVVADVAATPALAASAFATALAAGLAGALAVASCAAFAAATARANRLLPHLVALDALALAAALWLAQPAVALAALAIVCCWSWRRLFARGVRRPA
jgi:hypothetical protein